MFRRFPCCLLCSSPAIINLGRESIAPSREMWNYICDQSTTNLIGDDVYGEDQIVNRLQDRVAKEIFGKKAALFFPTHRGANLATVLAYSSCCGNSSKTTKFVAHHEHVRWLAEEDEPVGFLTRKRLLPLPRSSSSSTSFSSPRPPRPSPSSSSSFVVLITENTVSSLGGSIDDNTSLASPEVQGVFSAIHCEGERFWNLKSGSGGTSGLPSGSFAHLARPYNSLTVSLSQGLGGSGGSLLISDDEEFIANRASRARKQLGLGMRQIGMLAAGAYFRLFVEFQNESGSGGYERMLRLDGDKAREFASRFEQSEHMKLVRVPQTNIVEFEVRCRSNNNYSQSVDSLLQSVKREHGVLFGRKDNTNILTAVFHRDVNDMTRVQEALCSLETKLRDQDAL